MNIPRPHDDSEQVSDLQMPDPCDHPDGYDHDRVAHSRAFAEYCLTERRNVSPISLQYFTLLRGACDRFLDASARGFQGVNKFHLISQVREVETEIKGRDWLRHAATEDAERASAELLRARKVQMYARYGDYLAHVCHKLRVTADLKQTKDRELLSRHNRWTAIAGIIRSQLEERKERQRKPFSNGGPEAQDCPELRALEAAAEAAGINAEEALFAVTGYGERNELVHNRLEDELQMANHESIGRIAHILSRDLNDINAVISVELQQERKMFIAIIQHLISHWCRDSGVTNDPDLWSATDEFREAHILPAILKDKKEKSPAGELEAHRAMEKKLQSHKEKAEKAKQNVLREISDYLERHPPAGMLRSRVANPGKAAKKSKKDMYDTIRALSDRAGRRYRWSMRREHQLQRLFQDSQALEKELLQNKDLTARYRKERDTRRDTVV